MPRLAFAAALSNACLLALGACSPTPEQKGTESAAETVAAALAGEAGLPAMFQAAYRLDAQIFDEDGGQAQPIVMIRDGSKTRMEIHRVGEGRAIILVNGDESIMIIDMMGTQMALRTPAGSAPETPDAEWSQADPNVVRRGPCSAAGETGIEFASTDTGAGSQGVACITSDGIILKATENGRTVWEATRVQRGPQDPALFTVPAGVQVQDMGALMEGARGMIPARQ